MSSERKISFDVKISCLQSVFYLYNYTIDLVNVTWLTSKPTEVTEFCARLTQPFQIRFVRSFVPSLHFSVQSWQWKYQNVWRTRTVCKIRTKLKKSTRSTSMTSLWCLYCQFWTDFTHCAGVFIVDFEQVNACWV